MTNLGGMAPRAVSSYSLATTSHPLAQMPEVNQEANPKDEEVLDVLRRYLAGQDLMSV
jgi:chitin synthase